MKEEIKALIAIEKDKVENPSKRTKWDLIRGTIFAFIVFGFAVYGFICFSIKVYGWL